MIRFQTYRKSFLYFSEEIKKTASTVSGIRRLIVQSTQNSVRIFYTRGVQVHSPSKNIYGSAFLILDKIYARKWLCQAISGHNIFFV